MPDEPAAAEFRVEDHPDPADLEVLETQIRREASAAMGLGDEADLAIFVRDGGRVVAGISGWTWGDCWTRSTTGPLYVGVLLLIHADARPLPGS